MTRLLFATLLLLCACAGFAAEKPVLAIINGSTDAAAADVLLTKLSAGGEFVFVERTRLDEVVREQKLSSTSRESNVRTGQILGADALLFVESEATLLHLRLVETGRGERLFDEVFPLKPLDLAAVATAVRGRLTLLAGGLRTAPRDRLYVALGPVATFHPTPAFGETLATLSTLVGVRLAQQERILVVEREKLAAVTAEQSLTGKSAADLVPADVILRGRLVDGDANTLKLEFQVQRSSGAAPAVFALTVDRSRLAEAAAGISASLVKALGVATGPARPEVLAAEAQRHFRNGATLLQAQLFEPALRFLETACLLEPANETYARAYLGAVATCMLERAGGSYATGGVLSAAEYMYFTDRLRSAMSVASAHPPALGMALARGRRVVAILAVKNDNLDADSRAQVAACRGELRAFFERLATVDKEGWRLLGNYCPLFFSEPRAAFAYLRGVVDAGHFSWPQLREHIFPRVSYWDQALAAELWNGFLDEVQRKPDPEAQFSAILARCFLQSAFPSEYASSPRGLGRPAAEQLFAWLAASDEHLDWVLAHEKWDINLRIWNALYSLSIEDQDRYFTAPMMKFLQRAKGSEHEAFTYLTTRYIENVTHAKAPQDEADIRRRLEEALAALAAVNPAKHADLRASLAGNKWLSTLLPPAAKAERLMPEIPGGVLLYDSADHEEDVRYFDSFAGLVEGDVLWLAHTQNRAIAVTRVQLSRRTSETCLIPVEGASVGGFEQISLARSPTHVIVADRYRVFALAVADQAPYLDAKRCEIAGPQFGADATGGELQRELGARVMKGAQFRQITAAVPAGAFVYIALDERNNTNSCLYGALYRWRLGSGDLEPVCASDSLKPGPLNDCLPYSIVGGCAAPAGGAAWFVLEETPNQPAKFAEGQRRGVWKLTPSSGKWERLSEERLGSSRERPRLRTGMLLDIPCYGTAHFQLDLATGQVRPAAGAAGGADPARGWSAGLEVESGVRYERLYRIDGKTKTRVLSLSSREFYMTSLLPTENGLIVLLAGLQPAASSPPPAASLTCCPRKSSDCRRRGEAGAPRGAAHGLPPPPTRRSNHHCA
ncbi:MAG TPA: CsgG/HfaB family protein [Chthoniobacteraceae bacterium]|nr:CsgG/HfaB family protein [Chthoniobacteraceae bacterium]